MNSWNDKMIKYYVREESRTHNIRKIVEKITSCNDFDLNNKAMIDFGCGLGLVDLYLSYLCSNITAIDISENAIDYLNDKINELEIDNIKTNLCDITNFSFGTKYDIGFFMNFMDIKSALNICKKSIKEDGLIIYIQRNYYGHRFNINNAVPHENFSEKAKTFLKDNKIDFDYEDFVLCEEIPFVDTGEAKEFFDVHDKNYFNNKLKNNDDSFTKNNMANQNIELDKIREKLSQLDDEVYKYVYKFDKPITIFYIKKENVL